jgi:hypothetical protein
MQHSRYLQIGLTTLMGISALIATGCAGGDDTRGDDATESDSAGTQVDALRGRHWHRSPTSGSAGESTIGGTSSTAGGSTAAGGTGSTVGSIPPACSICTTAQSCCNAVDGGPLCTFSADTCASSEAEGQAVYARNCLTTLRTTISAWALNRRTPPAACSLPQ